MWFKDHKIYHLYISALLFCALLNTIGAKITRNPDIKNNNRQNNDLSHPVVPGAERKPAKHENGDMDDNGEKKTTAKFGNVTSRFHGEFHEDNVTHECHDEQHGIHLASWKWCEYYEHILFCLIVILAGVFKLAFHHTPFLSDYLPESCALIIVGIISGSFIYYGVNSPNHPFPKFTHSLFFNYLLPPIVLDAAYSLYDRDFLYNIGSIITFAVIGTLFNVFTVGFGLYLLEYIRK